MVEKLCLGEFDMITKRQKRRKRAQEIALFILQQQEEIEYRYLAELVNKSVSRISCYNLSNIMKPYLDDGTITTSVSWTNRQRNYVWKLNNS